MENISCVSVVLGVLTGLVGILYVFFAIRFRYWKNKGVLYLKPSFPLGNCTDLVLFRKPMGFMFTEHYRKFEGNKYGGIFLAHRPQLILRDPELIKTFLVKDFDHFHDHGFDFDETVDPLAGNLLLQTGQKWKDLRTKLSPTFTSGKMKMMFHTLVECAEELKEHLKKPADECDMLEFKDVLAKFTTDIIASCAFGIQCNCLKNPDAEFRQWGKKIFEPTFDAISRGIFYLLLPKVAIALKISSKSKGITNFFRTIVHETVNFREKHSVNRKDFLQLLIQLKNKGQVDVDGPGEQNNEKIGGMTMDEIAAQVFVFFIAGFETSSTTMSFALHELALNPDIQQRLREEVNRILEKHNGALTYEGIQEMEYMDKVISETLRKYPPISFLNRECTKDYRIPGTTVDVEKGTNIVIPVHGLHYDPKYYPDPEKFDPERFSDEVKNKRHHYVYLPFGEGPRICIGMRFGLMQTKVGLATMLSNYELQVCEKTANPLEMDPMQFITTPIQGIWLRLKNIKEPRS